jgi:hypothetical protein
MKPHIMQFYPASSAILNTFFAKRLHQDTEGEGGGKRKERE